MRSRSLLALAALALLATCKTPHEDEPPPRVKVPTSLWDRVRAEGEVRVIVELAAPYEHEEDLSPDEALAQSRRIMKDTTDLLGALGLQPNEVTRFPVVPFVGLGTNEARLHQLEDSPHVATVRADVPLKTKWSPSAASAAPVELDEIVELIGATKAWEAGYDGTGAIIAVIDDGVDDAHSLLAGQVMGGGWWVRGERGGVGGTAGLTIADPKAPALGKPLGATSEAAPNHGTAIAAIACGKSEFGNGIAPGAKILSLRVADETGVVWTSDVALALLEVWLEWNTSNEVAAVCLSLAAANEVHASGSIDCSDLSPLLDKVAWILDRKGIPVVIGSGNDWSQDGISFPACLGGVVSVGATEKDDTIWPGTNRPPELLAPGSKVRIPTKGGIVELFPGTSLSVPHVAGALAILHQCYPALPAHDLVEALEKTGAPVRLQVAQQLAAGVAAAAASSPTRPRIQIDAALQYLSVPHP